MGPRVTIRAASDGDVPAIRGVYRRASLSNDGDRALLTAHPELLDWRDTAVGEGRTQVAELHGRVVGFATLAVVDGVATVEDLFVDPDAMGGGIGRALVHDLAVRARGAGWGRIEVDANPHAVAFYERVGFVAVGEVAMEYGLGVRMHLDVER